MNKAPRCKLCHKRHWLRVSCFEAGLVALVLDGGIALEGVTEAPVSRETMQRIYDWDQRERDLGLRR